ncbi:Bug family tripartite tricarboxylate transporter substrate binding protein [Limnohabitans sp.]|uniref:Bug family tripartite tricarboxylate transporter substrate binding protein n=1 Tax=Limnohabitans sp. TaxID=1907725 RepID=UPI0038BA6CBC
MKKWFALALALFVCSGTCAQSNWPNRPIKLLVPYPAGGSTDILARLLGQKLSEALAQPVVIDNKGGASGGVAASYFVKSALDDHAFMVASLPMMSINQFLYKKMGYDPDADLAPIGLIAQTPNVLVVSSQMPVASLKELAARAKTLPVPMSYSSSSSGSAGHLLNELFKSNVGIELIHVPYRGNGPAMAALLAGDVQFTTDNLPQLLPQIRAGKLKPLAVTSAKRWFQLPDVPTVSESGFANMTTSAWFGLVAQSKVPADVVARMNRELNAVLNSPDFAAKLRDVSFEGMPGTPADMKHASVRERDNWKKVIEQSGASAE